MTMPPKETTFLGAPVLAALLLGGCGFISAYQERRGTYVENPVGASQPSAPVSAVRTAPTTLVAPTQEQIDWHWHAAEQYVENAALCKTDFSPLTLMRTLGPASGAFTIARRNHSRGLSVSTLTSMRPFMVIGMPISKIEILGPMDQESELALDMKGTTEGVLQALKARKIFIARRKGEDRDTYVHKYSTQDGNSYQIVVAREPGKTLMLRCSAVRAN